MSEETKRKRRRKRLDEIEVTGVLAQRRDEQGRRKIKLRQAEREDFRRQEMIERAVALFLDTRSDHTWEEIAASLHISVMALKDLTKSQDFMDKYDEHFAELGHDPRLRSAQAAIVDLLPRAIRELQSLLMGTETPASVKLKAIEKIIELNGIQPGKGGQMDRNELVEFLRQANIVIQQNNFGEAVQNPYGGNISAYTEGRWMDIESHPAAERAVFPEQDAALAEDEAS